VELTRDDFEIWKVMPETQAALGVVAEEINQLTAALTTGGTIDNNSIDRTALSTALAVGRIKGLRKLIEMEFEEE